MNRPVAVRALLGASSLLAAVVAAGAAPPAHAAPVTQGSLTLQLLSIPAGNVGPAQIESEAGCANQGRDRFLVTDTDGHPNGSATFCATRLAQSSEPLLFALDAQLTLHLGGGTISVNPGASYLVDSPPGSPAFAGPDYCWSRYDPGSASLSCAGMITSATGVYRGASGWVTYQWFWVNAQPGGPSFYWLQEPTITIDFS